MENLLRLKIPGLDAYALKIIAFRWNTLHEHLSPYFRDTPWFIVLRFPADNLQRKQLERTIEQHLASRHPSSLPGPVDLSQGWRERILLPIAAELGFLAMAERNQISLCISRGWFDRPTPRGKLKLRPTADELLPGIAIIRATLDTTVKRTKALRQQQICRDDKAANEVAKELADGYIGRLALSMLISLLGNFGAYGQIGLLSLSDHPLREELLLLERQSGYVVELSSDPQSVLAKVREDIIALYNGLRNAHPALWQPDLLHGRSGTQRRKDFTKSLYPRLNKLVISGIAAHRGCDIDTAQLLLWLFSLAGLPAIIGWRCGLETKTAYRTFERQYVLMTLEWVTTGMSSGARDECQRITLCLLEALQEVDFQFSFRPLLTEYPSSSRRRRWGRRFWFGVPAVVSRRRVYRRSLKSKANARRAWSQGHYTLDRQRAERLVARFAEIAVLDENDARARLRDFLTYGVLGLLPRRQWEDVVDPRILSWLRLIKLGRLDGTINWGIVGRRLEQYAASLDLPVPNIQVVRALFNSIPKPRYWHGGKGIAVDGIRQRAMLVLFGRPRLHAVWLVIYFPITLELSQASPQRYHMLLVVDEGSELPMGGWLSRELPTSREVGLALYQAIWHPGVLDWPLHGIPEIIRVPGSLVAQGCEALQRAASYLLTEFTIEEKLSLEGKERIRQIRASLQREAAKAIRVHDESQSLSEGLALIRLLEWLVPRYFPNHRAAVVPAAIRAHNVAMAGHDTPAAGWLLPRAGDAETDTNSIITQGRRYANRWFRSEPGQFLAQRECLLYRPAPEGDEAEEGIFVEVVQGDSIALHYLTEAK